LALIVFVALPIRFWQVHRHAQLLTSVIDSIAKGDPDIRLVLDLVDGDPSQDWEPLPITTTAEATPPTEFKGVEVLSLSRIVDLRWGDLRSGEKVRIRDSRRLKSAGFIQLMPRWLTISRSTSISQVWRWARR
jgi:hypothetical protein